MHNPATLRIIARAGLWAALAFVLNLTWEIAHVRLYTIWAEAERRPKGNDGHLREVVLVQ